MESGKKSPPKASCHGRRGRSCAKKGEKRAARLGTAARRYAQRPAQREAECWSPLKKTAFFRYNAEKAELRTLAGGAVFPAPADRCAEVFGKAGAAWTVTNLFERRRKDGACPSAWFRNCVQRAAFRGRRNSAAPGRSPRTPPSRRTCAGPGTGRGTGRRPWRLCPGLRSRQPGRTLCR